MWDQRGGIRDQKGGIRDRAVSFLWDQGPKFVTLLEPRIRNLGTKTGSVMIRHYDPAITSLKQNKAMS